MTDFHLGLQLEYTKRDFDNCKITTTLFLFVYLGPKCTWAFWWILTSIHKNSREILFYVKLCKFHMNFFLFFINNTKLDINFIMNKSHRSSYLTGDPRFFLCTEEKICNFQILCLILVIQLNVKYFCCKHLTWKWGQNRKKNCVTLLTGTEIL